jgi:hypothetical protein
MNYFKECKDVRVLSVVRTECPDWQATRNGKRYNGKCVLPDHGRRHKTVSPDLWSPCFVVDDHFNKWFCNGECAQTKGNDAVDFIYYLKGFADRKEAAAYLLAHKADYEQWTEPPEESEPEPEHKPVWDWKRALQPFPWHHIETLSDLRGVSQRSVRTAINRGLLWSLSSYEGEAWVVTDWTRRQAVWRKLDGTLWKDGSKAKLLKGCSGKRCIGLDSALAFGQIVVVEGGPDLLAARQS